MLCVLFGEVLDQPNCGISAPSKLAHDLVLVCINIADVDRVKATGLVRITAFLNVDWTDDDLLPGISALLDGVHPDSNPSAANNFTVNYRHTTCNNPRNFTDSR